MEPASCSQQDPCFSSTLPFYLLEDKKTDIFLFWISGFHLTAVSSLLFQFIEEFAASKHTNNTIVDI